MKRKVCIGLLGIALVSTGWAADVTVDADGDPNAVSYRVYKKKLNDPTYVDFIDIPSFPAIYPNVDNAGTTMFKACSLNATGKEYCRDEAGAWYDADSAPLTMQGVRIP